jgi:3-methyl-2-oxobutanoate hydroxymethyltransferase
MDKVTVTTLQQMKEETKKITMLTSYDYPITQILDGAGVDVLLVGDSAGNVVSGYANTLPVTMEEMLYHTRAVTRGAQRALVVGDMPFMSYQTSLEEARRNAGRFLKEGGAGCVKLEGGTTMEEVIRTIVEIDIPVMAHIGLTPQSVHRMGGFKVQGRDESQRKQLLEDARAVERAGAFAVVMECVPAGLAKEITEALTIPTIGIGAGTDCDGQVLVIHDVLGLLKGFRPKFVKQYTNMQETVDSAVKEFIDEVREGSFPGKEHIFQ